MARIPASGDRVADERHELAAVERSGDDDAESSGATASVSAAEATPLDRDSSRSTVHSVADAVRHPVAEPSVLVDGLLRAGESLVLASERGIGKSFAVMHLATQLARGSGAFLQRFPITQRARVLYVHGELDPWAAASRWQNLFDDAPPEDDMLLQLFETSGLTVERQTVRYPSSGKNEPTISITEYIARLDSKIEEAVRDEGVEVLIIDPLASFFRGVDENDNTAMELALGELRTLSLKFGVAVILVHHFGKATSSKGRPEDQWRGASRIADAVANRVTLKRLDEQRFEVHVLRRNEPSPSPFPIRRNPRSGVWESCETTLDEPDYELLQLLVDAGGSFPSTVRAGDALGMRDTTAKVRHLRPAVKRGHVITTDGRNGGTAWAITDAGRVALQQRSTPVAGPSANPPRPRSSHDVARIALRGSK